MISENNTLYILKDVTMKTNTESSLRLRKCPGTDTCAIRQDFIL